MKIVVPTSPTSFTIQVSEMELLAISDGLGRLGQAQDDVERYGEQSFTYKLWKECLQALGRWEHTP